MEIQFKWIGGATFILTVGELKIAIDPVLCEKGKVQDYFWFKSERIEQPMFSETDFDDVDIWLITHNHEDHLDNSGLSRISNTARIFCNKNAHKILKTKGKKQLSVMAWRQVNTMQIKGYGIEIEAVPAIHGVSPLSALLAGKVNGYYMRISKGAEQVKIYITGDTVYKTKIIRSFDNKQIDLLIPNMGAAKQGSWIMTLTLNSQMLRKMIAKLNPKIVIPVHYGTFEHYIEPVERIKELNDDRIKIVSVGSKTQIIINTGSI